MRAVIPAGWYKVCTVNWMDLGSPSAAPLFLEWRTAQQIGRCLESAAKSPCNFSGSVLPSVFLIACLIPTVRFYVVCWRHICILLLLIILAGLLKSRMRSMDCKVVQCSNTKCWEPHRFPCKSSFAICVSDLWRYGGKLLTLFHQPTAISQSLGL